MNIHLIRESSFGRESFNAVVEVLHRYPGPVKFVSHEEPVKYSDDDLMEELWDDERLKTKKVFYSDCLISPSRVVNVTWDNIFDQCKEARKLHRIPASEPVVLLTHHANEYNWFQGADPSGKQNLFVQTSMWDLFVGTDIIYPVIHQLATIPLKVLMYDDFRERVLKAHERPRGCINDLCKDKTEITFKLRTADICAECREIIARRQIDPLITAQVIEILEGIRTQFTYYSSITGNSGPARLEINYRERTFSLPELGITLPFGPMESAVYHLFLSHPEGIAYSALPNDYKNELFRLYSHYSDTGSIGTLQSRVDKICSDRDNMSNVISRIRRKVESTVPQAISRYYVISGEGGMKQKIRIDRGVVGVVE